MIVLQIRLYFYFETGELEVEELKESEPIKILQVSIFVAICHFIVEVLVIYIESNAF